jgi:sulfide:quinone oxidoreductase
MRRRRILILGASFAGLTAALDLRQRLGAAHDVAVISDRDEFVFLPSLIWVPFGLKEKEEISFPIAPVLDKRGIRFVHAAVDSIDLAHRTVEAGVATEPYDFLVIATGPKLDFAAVPGLGPKGGFTQSIFSWPHAELARRAFEVLVHAPGPVVIGGVQGAMFFGGAYELALNVAMHLRKRGISPATAPITFVTPEPYVGHLGIGGSDETRQALERLMEKNGIRVITDAVVSEVTKAEVVLAGGPRLPHVFSMLTPPFVGVDPVRACTDIVDDAGFVRVRPDLSTEAHPEVFAAGSALSIPPIEQTKVPCGAPRTGHMAEKMAAVVARNIAARIERRKTTDVDIRALQVPFVIDAGDDGVILARDRFLAPDAAVSLTSGAVAHWAKTAHERWFMALHRRGIRA